VLLALEEGAVELVEESPYRFRIDQHGGMRVPGVVFASRSLLPHVGADKSLEQVANVAMLPGIVEASYVMPDVHWGYGFPISGVAATDIEAGGVVSPGGVVSTSRAGCGGCSPPTSTGRSCRIGWRR
jgi:tRNA-splicing ligase RtcB